MSLSLDVRHQKDSVRRAAIARAQTLAREIGAVRDLKVSHRLVRRVAAVPSCQRLSTLLERAVRRHQPEVVALASGAGHDAAMMAALASVAMLSVRCEGGLSHHPAESAKLGDVRVALAVMRDFVELLAISSSG